MRSLQRDKIYAVELKGHEHEEDEIGEAAESILTNSEHIAEIIKKANCRTCEDVSEAVNEEVKKQHWGYFPESVRAAHEGGRYSEIRLAKWNV